MSPHRPRLPMSRRLPGSVQQIADIIGETEALALVAILPRVRRDYPSGDAVLYVPKVMPVDHKFVAAIGYPAAAKLSRHYGGELLFIATCAGLRKAERNAEIFEALKRATPAAVAIRFSVSERHVRRVAASFRKDIPPMQNASERDDHTRNLAASARAA